MILYFQVVKKHDYLDSFQSDVRNVIDYLNSNKNSHDI